ncbi:hypothetical protein HPB49_003965 [Dermacentor silvarum]|uniref:Uncharacterized protein n=1 Tax=Dermacentor silvarum TaxID=543639 RepID=A0ACB8C219_DERSI|nr:hypothetical protein HPB49_003965 [Dermacentor silvarum]
MTQVEVLVMKALSLGLVRGTIDQVDGQVHMQWVQPRVLSREQTDTVQPVVTQMVARKNRTCAEIRIVSRCHPAVIIKSCVGFKGGWRS